MAHFYAYTLLASDFVLWHDEKGGKCFDDFGGVLMPAMTERVGS